MDMYESSGVKQYQQKIRAEFIEVEVTFFLLIHGCMLDIVLLVQN